MKTRARLTAMENQQAAAENREFVRTFQLAVLLALKEEGVLSESQCRRAEEGRP